MLDEGIPNQNSEPGIFIFSINMDYSFLIVDNIHSFIVFIKRVSK